MRRVLGVGVVAAVVLGGALGAPLAAQAADRNAAPPSASALTSATNAMLRPSDVPTTISSLPSQYSDADDFRTGFLNPPGGQDPLPVCSYGNDFKTVSVPVSGATGYLVTSGVVTQNVYAYPSAAEASAAWRTVTTQLQARCKGSFTRDGKKFSVNASSIPGLGGVSGWGVNSRGYQASYSALHNLGNAIQMVTVMSSAPAINATRAGAVNTLAATLAGRWVDQANLPLTQDPFITQAARTMLQPADVPATLPITQPSNGGWSSFLANLPGSSPSTCNARAKILAGAESFTTSLGGEGDVFPLPGAISQSVFVYDSAADAQRAWNQLKTAQAKCTENAGKPIPASGSFNREVNGVSPLTFGGVPGIWLRELMIEDFGISQKSYSIDLLLGNAIQTVTYTRSINKAGQVPLDQAAVNALAESLALRWVAGSAQPRS